jgi:hypothetical protein
MMPTMMMTDRLSLLTDAQLRDIKTLDRVRLIGSLGDVTERAPRSLSNGLDLSLAFAQYEARWSGSVQGDQVTRRKDWLQKAASNPGVTTEPSWAAPLAAVRPLLDAFVDLARAQSLIGKLMSAAARTPFNVSVPVALGGGTYRWTGQAAAAPVGNMSLASATLPIAKASGIIVVTNELLRLTAPGSDVALRRELIRGMAGVLGRAVHGSHGECGRERLAGLHHECGAVDRE